MRTMSSELTIRSFRPGDLDQVISLWSVTIAHPKALDQPRQAIVRKFVGGEGMFLVAEPDQKIVGSVQAGYDGVRGWIYKLAVSPDRQHQGVGRRLLEEAERALTG